VALKPDLFEGMRFDLTKMITPYFALTHRYLVHLRVLSARSGCVPMFS
jgi:hypothetical protein